MLRNLNSGENSSNNNITDNNKDNTNDEFEINNYQDALNFLNII